MSTIVVFPSLPLTEKQTLPEFWLSEHEHNAKAHISVAALNPATLALTEAQGVLISISIRHMFLQDKAVSHHCCYLNFGNKGKGFGIIVKNNETHILCAQDTVN